MKQSKLRALSLVLITSLSACGGGKSASIPAVASGSTPVIPGALSGPSSFSYGAAMLAGSTSSTPADIGALKVDVALQLRNGAGLIQYAQAVSTPKSAAYRHFLTPRQIADEYGATVADAAKTAAYFRRFGLDVGGWTQRLSVAVSGPQKAMEAAFHTHFVSYATPRGAVYGPKEKPAFDEALPVVAVANLITGAKVLRRNLVQVAAAGSGQNHAFGYVPQQIAAAFDFNGAYNAGFRGDGISIGIIGTGPIDQNDYATFKREFNVPGTATITQIAATAGAAAVVQSGLGMGSPVATPPPVTAPCSGALPACNPEDLEAQIDTQQAAALGYDASVLFYLAYVPQSPNGPQIGLSEFDDEIQQAIMDNSADVLSLSFGGAESGLASYLLGPNNVYNSNAFGPTEFAALAAEGIATFVSSGDSGAQGCAHFSFFSAASGNCVEYPASDASVTAVGGVTTPLDNAGRFVGPLTAWGLQTQSGFSGTGGGVSAYVPAPVWQTGSGVTSGLRNLPDVSLEADQNTGVATIVNASYGFKGTGAYGGTSVAAPETAAMWALVLSACKQTPACAAKGTGPHPYRLGNAAPLFYGIYNNAAQYPTTFYDVVYGNNGVIACTQLGFCPQPLPTPEPGFNAGVGFDLTTGIGVPFARHLIQSIVGV
jgi:subtilase family serine protease